MYPAHPLPLDVQPRTIFTSHFTRQIYYRVIICTNLRAMQTHNTMNGTLVVAVLYQHQPTNSLSVDRNTYNTAPTVTNKDARFRLLVRE